MNQHDEEIIRRKTESANLWKYCSPEQIKEALKSFHLLDGISVGEEKELACLYAVSNHVESHYHPAEIKKKNGGVRHLLVPDGLLRTIQRNIVRHVLCEIPVSDCATAYRAQTSVVSNAHPHVGAEQIMKLDIRHFFENISFPLVYQYAFPAEYFPPAIRTMLTTLCCYKDYLPQGAPTSPAVSNLVMKSFDEYMKEWCQEWNVQYTRYCDDLTFSGIFDRKMLKNKVKGYLLAMGFELNEKKTRVLGKQNRQIVTGIVVNEKLQVSREYRRQLRAEIYYCKKYGVEQHLRWRSRQRGAQDSGGECDRNECRQSEKEVCTGYLQHLLGKVNYVLLVNPEDVYFQNAREELRNMQADYDPNGET